MIAREKTTFYWLVLVLWYSFIGCIQGTGNSLVARDLLKTIAPNSKPPSLPAGLPALDTISTDKFRYKITGKHVIVNAELDDDEVVAMFPGQVFVTNIKLKFLYDKETKADWKAEIKGQWKVGSKNLNLEIFPNGTFTTEADSIVLGQLATHFYKENTKDIGVATDKITIKNCKIKATIDQVAENLKISFIGDFNIPGSSDRTAQIKTIVSQTTDKQPLKMYTIMDFTDTVPKKVLDEILNRRTLGVTFFSHLTSSSSLFNEEKNSFGITLSFAEVYYYQDNSVASRVLQSVLQSHIPVGVAILFPLDSSSQKRDANTKPTSKILNLAFVVNRPIFDLLIDENSRMSVNEVLPILSKEFRVAKSKNSLPKFIKKLHEAYTTHISFDSSLSHFYVFIRLKIPMDLVTNSLRIKLTNLVLHKDVKQLGSKNGEWKVSAKGSYRIGDSKFDVQYTELETNGEENQYGLTGHSDGLSLSDVLEEFNPYFYPNKESKLMIDNTEIDTLRLHDIKLFSRIQPENGTPHVLLTGLADLPQWERNIQVAMLVIRVGKKWDVKWAMSFKHSPLTNIVEALTGFKSEEIPFLHNSHIMTTLISSPMENMKQLPPHIITTPLLRLQVKKGLTLISLLKFPDSCGDDKMCDAASSLLNTDKVYTAKATLSTKEFELVADVQDAIELSDELKGVNNSIRFTIGNTSRMDVMTTVHFPRTGLVFKGPVHIYKTGQTTLQMSCTTKRWVAPFDMRAISIKKLKFVADYEDGKSLRKLAMDGIVQLGLQGNGEEIQTPVHIQYNTGAPALSTFYGNFTDISTKRLLKAFTIDVALPEVLETSTFPSGLMLTYSGKRKLTSDFSLHGELQIFGRSLYCAVSINHPGIIKIVTENSPAPVIYARGLIIVQESRKSKLRGPKIIAQISHKDARVTMKGFVKLLGIESDVEVQLNDEGIEFEVEGKLMEYKSTKLKAKSTRTPDDFKVHGCIEDVTLEVQLLLVETITKSANQSVVNMQKAEDNFLNARKFYTLTEDEEARRREERDRARVSFEDALVDFGRYDVIAKDTCTKEQCTFKCFGCPKLNHCCRLDIFGHCIACASWKSCCWKNIDPLCIAKQDGCHVIRAQAEKELAVKEARIVQERILLDNLEQLLTNSEMEKGKHKAVLEAAIDAKQIVEEDSTPGLNAHDAIRIFGEPYDWAKVNSVCYNTSVMQAATGCMEFVINVDFFNRGQKNIKLWSCLKEDLVTELTESLANYIFPNMIDTTTDSVQVVASKLNGAEANQQQQQHRLVNFTQYVPKVVPIAEPHPVVTVGGPPLLNISSSTPIDNMEYSLQGGNSPTKTRLTPTMTPPETNQGNADQPQGDDQEDNDENQDIIDASQASNQGDTPTQQTTNQGTDSPPPTASTNNTLESNTNTSQDDAEEENIDLPQVNNSTAGATTGVYSGGQFKLQPKPNMVTMPVNLNVSQPSGKLTDPVSVDQQQNTPTNLSSGQSNQTVVLPIKPEPDHDQPVANQAEQAPIYSGSGEEVSGHSPSKTKQNGNLNVDNDASGDDAAGIDATFSSGEDDEEDEDDDGEETSAEITVTPGEEPDKAASTQQKQQQQQQQQQQQANTSNITTTSTGNATQMNRGRFATYAQHPTNSKSKGSQQQQQQQQPATQKPNQQYPYNTTNSSYPYVMPPLEYGKPKQQTLGKNPTVQQHNTAAYNHANVGFSQQPGIAVNSYRQFHNAPASGAYMSANSASYNNKATNTVNARQSQAGVGRRRRRRSIGDLLKSSDSYENDKNILFSNPFWDIHIDHNAMQTRSDITRPKVYHKTLSRMINKRWLIPDNSGGKCHIFRQLMAICKDMAETIIALDHSLKEATSRFMDEDKSVYLELFKTEEDLITATKRVNVSGSVAMESAKTLGVVRQGVNIWSKRCTNEFEWQKQTGVYAWLQAMDLRIQELGGYGVFRFLDNLFNAFQALFDASGRDNLESDYAIVERTRRISEAFHKVFKQKLDVSTSREYASSILEELNEMRKTKIDFCR